MMTMRDCRPPASRTNRLRTTERPSLSSAPPMISRVRRGDPSADNRCPPCAMAPTLGAGTAGGSAGREKRWRRSGRAVRRVRLLHLLAADAEEVQDGVQVRDVDGGVGLFPHHRLGVEGDAESRGGEHVEVVGAVPDGHGAAEREAGVRREPAQGPLLAGAVDDLAHDVPGEAAVHDLQAVRLGAVDAELRGERADDLDEPAGDDGDHEAEALEGAYEGAGTGGERD